MPVCQQCSQPCERVRLGLCDRHYQAQRRASKPRLVRKDQVDRFFEKVKQLDDCWVWTASCDGKGYGKFYANPTDGLVSAHRFSYELHLGQIPAGLELDHLCRNSSCVNPYHLDPVSHKENVRRGVPYMVPRNRKTTHCPKKHAYDEANTRVYTNPTTGRTSRNCRACEGERQRG